MESPQQAKSRIHASIRMIFPSNKWKEVLNTLHPLVEQTKLEEGCVSCRLYRDVHEKRAFMLEQIWMGEKNLERHLCSNNFLPVLLVMEMATELPEIRFHTVSNSTGIDTIERVRA